MSISNKVFRFLQTSKSYIQTGDTVLDVDGSGSIITIPVPESILNDFIDKTLILTSTADDKQCVTQQEQQAELANYVLTTGSIMTGTLSMSGNSSIIFPDSSQQYQAYSNDKNAILNTVNNKTQNINVRGDDTTITNLTVLNNLNINPNSISIDKINNLQGDLNSINNNIGIANNNIATNTSDNR